MYIGDNLCWNFFNASVAFSHLVMLLIWMLNLLCEFQSENYNLTKKDFPQGCTELVHLTVLFLRELMYTISFCSVSDFQSHDSPFVMKITLKQIMELRALYQKVWAT